MHRILALICILLSWEVFAETVFPKGCKAVAVAEKVQLKIKKPTVILLRNVTDTDIWVASQSAVDLSKRLTAKRWSAIVLQPNNLTAACIESRPGHEQHVACGEALAVCQMTKIKMAANTTNTFWPSENMSLKALLTSLGRQGFIIKTV